MVLYSGVFSMRISSIWWLGIILTMWYRLIFWNKLSLNDRIIVRFIKEKIYCTHIHITQSVKRRHMRGTLVARLWRHNDNWRHYNTKLKQKLKFTKTPFAQPTDRPQSHKQMVIASNDMNTSLIGFTLHYKDCDMTHQISLNFVSIWINSLVYLSLSVFPLPNGRLNGSTTIRSVSSDKDSLNLCNFQIDIPLELIPFGLRSEQTRHNTTSQSFHNNLSCWNVFAHCFLSLSLSLPFVRMILWFGILLQHKIQNMWQIH